MNKKTYNIAIISLCVFAVLIFILSEIKIVLPPKMITAKEIPIIESYLHFQFPKSTKIIKAYWAPGDSTRYYLFFEFDNKDVDRFLKTLHWDEEIEKNYKGDVGWQSEQNVPEIEQLCDPILKADRVFFGTPESSEVLEWWKPNKSKVDKVFWLSDAKLRDVDVYVINVAILLEQLEKTCQVYVYASWESLEDGGYMNKWYHLFPYDEHWKYRETQSIPNPLQRAVKPVEGDSQ